MNMDSSTQYEKNVDDESNHLQKMSLSDPQEQNKEKNPSDDGINQLQKMSLSDPQVQNKKDIDGEDGYYEFQKSSSAWWHADDYFERLSPEEMLAQLTPCREWREAHTCTSCGRLDHRCRCKQPMEIVEPMYAPPLRPWW